MEALIDILQGCQEQARKGRERIEGSSTGTHGPEPVGDITLEIQFSRYSYIATLNSPLPLCQEQCPSTK